MENTNNYEVMTNGNQVDMETGEITPSEIVVHETPEYKIVRLEDGKFKKNMKYKQYFSKVAETEEEKIELYQVFNDSESEKVTPLKNMIGKKINIAHVFTQPYESFDETTGNVTDGVTTTMQDVDGSYYATSSKSVYHKINSIMDAFGRPDEENYKPVEVEVTGAKQKNGVQIDLKLIGLSK